jgi:dTDP-4-dehydrorhamnose reductase
VPEKVNKQQHQQMHITYCFLHWGGLWEWQTQKSTKGRKVGPKKDGCSTQMGTTKKWRKWRRRIQSKKYGAKIVHVSTDYVFDGTAHQPYTEDQPTCPQSVYGRSKVACEQEVMQICRQTMIIRTAWMYSIFGNNFVKTMIRLGRERSQLGVVFDQIGTPTLASDLAAVIYTAIDQGIQPGIYHYSNEGVCSWYDFALAIHRLAGITNCAVRPLHTNEYPAKATRPHYAVLDKTKIKETYGITIPHWEESLKRCIERLTIDN